MKFAGASRLLGSLALLLLVLSGLLLAAPGQRLYASILTTACYALVPWLLPKCRFERERYLCPMNLALGLFFLKLVLIPFLIMVDHASAGTLAEVPRHSAMEWALVVETIAFVAFCLGVQFVSETPRELPAVFHRLNTRPPNSMLVVYVFLGLVGMYAFFGSVGALLEYFVNPATVVGLKENAEGTWPGLGGTVLRPFLPFAILLLWTRFLDRHPGEGATPRILAATAATGLAVVAINLTYAFNRASFIFPLLTMSAVFIARIRRFSPMLLLAAAAVLLPLLIALGTYRAGTQQAADVMADNSKLVDSARDFSTQVQVYGSGPQFLGFFLETMGWGRDLRYGSTLVSSAMSPVPLLGKGFRENSGTAIYNRAIYNQEGIEDQIIPFQGELFLNFHIAGVAFGYFLLGMLLAKMQHWFEAATSAFTAYFIQYAALWFTMLILWSLQIICQIYIYFCWPVYVLIGYGYLMGWAARQRTRRQWVAAKGIA